MPRNGAGIYSIPLGTDGISDQTIESTKYNVSIHDFETDANLARPIVAGGTGANNAHDARVNIGAEVAGVQVTNYDSQIWECGSFWSASGATGSPVVGFFTGSAELLNNSQSDFVINVRDIFTHLAFYRVRRGGAWDGAWARSDQTALDFANTKVDKAGDTMSGHLVLPTGPAAANAVRKDYVDAQDALKVNKAGDTMTGPLFVNNATGSTSPTTGALTVAGGVGIGGDLYANNLFSTGGNVVSAALNASSNSQFILRDQASANKAILYWDHNTNDINLVNSTGGASVAIMGATNYMRAALGVATRSGIGGAYGASAHNIFWTGSAAQLWVDGTNTGLITVTSDYRIKKDVADLPSTWAAVKALRPVSYTQAQFTPPVEVERKLKQALDARKSGTDASEVITPMYVADDIKRWGFIAHELQATLLPTAATGVKDQPDVVQSLNLAPVVAALTKALQEAMARIEALETAAI